MKQSEISPSPEVFANLPADHIIAAPDISSVYHLPLEFEKQQLGQKILNHFKLSSKKTPDWMPWIERVSHIERPHQRVRVAIIGKYIASGDYSMTDSYISICHALIHAGAELNTGIDITWIDSQLFERNDARVNDLSDYHGIIIPGGFGNMGVEGKIRAIEFVRTHNIPFLGLCYGMQLAAVEFARHVCHLNGAHTTEVDPHTHTGMRFAAIWLKQRNQSHAGSLQIACEMLRNIRQLS